MSISRLFLLLLAILYLSGCATLSKDDCQKADWAKIGYDDGYAGKKPEEFLKHKKACAAHGITADVKAYQKSRADALLDEYCTESRGFTLGRNGKLYHDVCPEPVEYAFKKGYNRGRKLYDEEQAHYRHVLKNKGVNNVPVRPVQ